MKGKGSTLPLQRGRQVAEDVDFKLIEAITMLDKLAVERVQCRAGRVAMLKVDNRRLDPAGQKLFDHLGVVPLHVCQEKINFSDLMFGKKGLHRQRLHLDLLHLHLHSGCFRIVEAANQGVFLEAGEHCQSAVSSRWSATNNRTVPSLSAMAAFSKASCFSCS
jgi:hypothetical protein